MVPESLEVVEIQHFASEVGQHERKDWILHEVIERTPCHLI